MHSYNLIVATDSGGGIGKNGKMAWKNSEELASFRKLTMNCVIIVGGTTSDNLPPLPGRDVLCVSKSRAKADPKVFSTIEDAYAMALALDKPIFIAGGGYTYDWVLTRGIYVDGVRVFPRKIYHSVLREKYDCDTFFRMPNYGWECEESIEYETFTLKILVYNSIGEGQYKSLLKKTLCTSLTEGRNGLTHSIFAPRLEFDLTRGFPLLTTKKMFLRGIVEELLFFIRGDTDTSKLEEKKVNIWKGNTNREFLNKMGMESRPVGVMGPMYGYQWRFFNAEYDENRAAARGPGIDQLKMVVNQIISDPHSRRILLTDYNPVQAKQGVLYPCHSIIIQFYVREVNGVKHLDMTCYNRSSDLFLGLPFNIASSALFLTLMAKITGCIPRRFILTLGDAHIYTNHVEAVKEQLTRIPYTFPTLNIAKDIKSVEDVEKLSASDITVSNYRCYRSIKAEMVA